MASGYFSPLAIGLADGPAITAAAATSCLPVTGKFTFPPNSLSAGSIIRVTAQGRISNAVTTPGTARLDVRLNNLVILDTGALTLNQVAKTNLPWWFDCIIACRVPGVIGTSSFFGFGRFQSEAIVGSPLASVGGSGSLLSAMAAGPETAPAPTLLVDTTVANPFDMFFTQTVTTGSFTVHNFLMETGSLALT
jgi:hypothetical protein